MIQDHNEIHAPVTEVPAVIWRNDIGTRDFIARTGTLVERRDAPRYYAVQINGPAMVIGVGTEHLVDKTAKKGDFIVVEQPSGKIEVVPAHIMPHRYREVTDA